MIKVIRLGKRWYNASLKYNNIYAINDALALAKRMAVFGRMPRRKALREYIIKRSLRHEGVVTEISHRDIKRMERAYKCEIPINIIDILEIIMEEIVIVREFFEYRAKDDAIISMHTIGNTIEYLRFVMDHMHDEQGEILPQFKKYEQEIAHVNRRIQEFDAKYLGVFDSIFI